MQCMQCCVCFPLSAMFGSSLKSASGSKMVGVSDAPIFCGIECHGRFGVVSHIPIKNLNKSASHHNC